VIHTDDPTLMSGYAIDHPPQCYLTNGAPMLGLTGNGTFDKSDVDNTNH
jgi:hypothetical protein